MVGRFSTGNDVCPRSSHPIQNLRVEGTSHPQESFRHIAPARLISFGAEAQTRSRLAQWMLHHHDSFVDLFCQRQAQEITVEVILCKYSRQGCRAAEVRERSRPKRGRHLEETSGAIAVLTLPGVLRNLFGAADDLVHQPCCADVCCPLKKIVYTSRFVRVILAQGPC